MGSTPEKLLSTVATVAAGGQLTLEDMQELVPVVTAAALEVMDMP